MCIPFKRDLNIRFKIIEEVSFYLCILRYVYTASSRTINIRHNMYAFRGNWKIVLISTKFEKKEIPVI